MPAIGYKDRNWERKIPRKDEPMYRDELGRFTKKPADPLIGVFDDLVEAIPMQMPGCNCAACHARRGEVKPPPEPKRDRYEEKESPEEWIRGILKNNNHQNTSGVDVMVPNSTLWKYGACCSQTLSPDGDGYRVKQESTKFNKQTMEDLGWTPDLFNDYLNFIKDCNPEFGLMILDASVTHPAILLKHPNPNTRYQAFCLFRLAWEWPRAAMMGVYLHKHTECNTSEIQIIIGVCCDGGGGHWHISCGSQSFLDEYDQEAIEDRLKNPPMPDEGLNGCGYKASGINYSWDAKEDKHPHLNTVSTPLAKKYGKGFFIEAMMIQEARRFFFKGIFGGDYGCQG